MRRALAALALLALLAASAVPIARGDDGDDTTGGGGSDSTVAGSDSTAVDDGEGREFLSSDGAVSVYKERQPGEGIEGFWWTYDANADLIRLLDKNARSDRLEKLTDAFGFEVALPGSMIALRDSVTAVADSILAVTIELETEFDPKLTTRYIERQDQYDLMNEITSAIPLTRRSTLSAKVTDSNTFNESTRKVKDDRSLSSTFTFAFRPGMSTTVSVNRKLSEQRRDATLENVNNTTGVTARGQARHELGMLGAVDLDLGFALNRRDYENTRTEGESSSFRPDWGARFSRPFAHGNASLDYSAGFSRGNRTERRTVTDSLGVESEVESEANDRDRDDKLAFASDYRLAEGSTLKLNANLSRNRVQFIAQADSVAGQQETRTGTVRSVRTRLDSKPFEGFEIRGSVGISRSQTEYDLETVKFARTTRRDADADIFYDPWSGGRFTIKFKRSVEDRDYLTAQAGVVDKKNASVDYRQDVTENINLSAGYFASLDVFEFDNQETNTGDRDLLQQRGTMTVGYTPVKRFKSSLKVEMRESQSLNIHPQRAGDSKTDYKFLVTPTYTLTLGRASINGEFKADARYSVFEFDDDRNSFSRTIGTRQRWQHAFTDRFTTDVLVTYDIQDDGSYSRSPVDGIRRFRKGQQVRRFRMETQLLYAPRPWFRTRFLFRRDGDNFYTVDKDGEHVPTSESRTEEFTLGLTFKKKLMRTINFDLDMSKTQKSGDRVTEVDRGYFTIRATLNYQPFRAPRKGGALGG